MPTTENNKRLPIWCSVYSLHDLKEKIQTYCVTTYAMRTVNEMWIHKNSKEFLVLFEIIFKKNIIKQRTTISHDKLKKRLFGTINSCFVNKMEIGHRSIQLLVDINLNPLTKTLTLILKCCWSSTLTMSILPVNRECLLSEAPDSTSGVFGGQCLPCS